MDFPIKLRWIDIDKGETQPMAKEDVVIPGYVVTDHQGIVVASGTCLADIFEYAIGIDQRFERFHQYLGSDKVAEAAHLEGIDIAEEMAPPSGLALPQNPGFGNGMH